MRAFEIGPQDGHMVGQSPEIPNLFTTTTLAETRPDWSEGLSGAYGARLTLASFENVGAPIRSTGGFAADAGAIPPRIRVQSQDAPPGEGQVLPTATIQRDGSVLDGAGQVAIDANGVVKNQAFVTNPPMQSDLTIAVQRDGQAAPTDAQQNVLNRLTDIWAKNIQSTYGDKLQTIQTTDGQTIKQVNIDDPNQLVAEAVQQKYGTGIPQDRIASTVPPPVESGTEANPTPDINPATSNYAGQVNRDFPQGGSGSVNSGDANQRYFPPRTAEDFEKGDDSAYASMLHSMARMPFDRVRHVVGGQRFGGYDTGPKTFGTWMLGFLPKSILDKLGHPPDLSKLAELLREDPDALKEIQAALKEKGAPKELQDNFKDADSAQKFAEFAGKVTTGHGEISAEDMKKFMPEALQTRMALDTVHQYKQAGAKPNDIALAWALDKTPDKLTAEERGSDQGKAIQAAGNRLFQLSYASRNAGPNDTINWTGDKIDPNSVAFRLVQNARATMDGTPYGCVRSHQANMQRTFGFTPHGDAWDNFKDTWSHLATTGKFDLVRVTSQSQLRAGDIFGVPWTARTTAAMGWGRNAGHVGTIGTNGVEYSQHAFSTGFLFSGRYDTNNLYVIRAKTSNS
jgi:hypothetical protein